MVYEFCQRHYLVEGEAVVQMAGINDFPGLYVLRGRQGLTGTFIPSYKWLIHLKRKCMKWVDLMVGKD